MNNPTSQPPVVLDIAVPVNAHPAKEDLQKPPRAPLVLRVGVTGHRLDPDKRPNPNIPVIRQVIAEVLGIIQDAVKGVADINTHMFSPPSAKTPTGEHYHLRIISSLAAGADHWVAEEAINLGYELQSPLPFECNEYLQDFTNPADAENYFELLCQAEAVLELDGKVDIESGIRRPDSRSYEAVGRAVLNQSDLLIAVWDGQPARGRGGAGQVINEAFERGIPVIWIHWNTPQDWHLQTPMWRFLENPQDAKNDSVRLTELVRELLLPSDSTNGSCESLQDSLRAEYFQETQKRGNLLLGWWTFFRNSICWQIWTKKGFLTAKKEFLAAITLKIFCVKNFVATERNKSDDDWKKKKSQENADMLHSPKELPRDWVDNNYLEHYAWANGLSMYYGNLYRSTFLVNYLLGAVAVFLALVSIAQGITGKGQAWWIIAELIVILIIIILTQSGRKRRWHQRFIDYRTLAERLRLARCLSLLGGGSPQIAYAGHLASYGNPASTWMHWHYRAIERAAGLPNVKIGSQYLASCQEFWRESLVEDQRAYHKSNSGKFRKFDRRLHYAGDGLFVLTLIACSIHFGHLWLEDNPKFDWIPHHLSGWMTLLCAFLPALGAAFAAIRSQCEALRLAQRSQAMEEELKELQFDLAKVATAENKLNSVQLRACADQVSELMTRELLDWRVVFQDRPLALPV
jgi:hypothetical protein